jgi:hypothetical protein
LTLRLPAAQPNVLVNTFASLESEEFKEYLHITPVHFVMVHDGSSRSTKTAENSEDERLAKILLRGMIWWWNTHQLNVALINRIEFRDSKVFTMIVESFTTSSKRKLLMTTQFVKEIKMNRELMEELRNPDGEDVEVKYKAIQELGEDSSVGLSESYYLAVYGVSTILKQQDCDVFMASAFILQSVILRHVPLSERRFPLITFDEDFDQQIDKFIAELSDVLRCVAEDSKWTGLMAAKNTQQDAVDVIDGRLFRAVIQAMCDNTLQDALPLAARKDWLALSKLVKQLTEQELSTNGSAEPESSETSASNSDFEPVPEDLAVLPFSHPVFDAHLKSIHVDTDTSLPARLGTMKLYRETTHWHNHKKPLTTKPPVVQKVSKWRYVRVFRILPYFAMFRTANNRQKSAQNKPILYERDDILRSKSYGSHRKGS